MSRENTVFCRMYLAEVMKDVKKFVKTEDRKKAWAWEDAFGMAEFHGPDGFYWYGHASNMSDAKAQGWSAYLTKIGAGEYAREEI